MCFTNWVPFPTRGGFSPFSPSVWALWLTRAADLLLHSLRRRLHVVRVRELLYRQSLRLCDNPLRLTTSNFIFQPNTCGYSPYVTSSLTRGWVWRLQLLLVSPAQSFSGRRPRGTHDHILLFQIRDSPKLGGQVPVFISPRTGLPSYSTRRCVPFSSPPTTRRAMVEVFDPAFTRPFG
jgi:hypothetical protein